MNAMAKSEYITEIAGWDAVRRATIEAVAEVRKRRPAQGTELYPWGHILETS